jgi:hypothetical protein
VINLRVTFVLNGSLKVIFEACTATECFIVKAIKATFRNKVCRECWYDVLSSLFVTADVYLRCGDCKDESQQWNFYTERI